MVYRHVKQVYVHFIQVYLYVITYTGVQVCYNLYKCAGKKCNIPITMSQILVSYYDCNTHL